MAKLFKDKVIKKNLENFPILNFEAKLEIVQKWLAAYRSKALHQKTETQCEQAFNQSFFVELLDYSTFPNEIYTLEPKGRTEATGQKPDAVLGYFSAEKTRTVAVVEIKDVNTPLDRSQKREGNLSPVQQAFKYKPQYKECDFVIATNFFEIRLHKDTQLDYELFTLESLANPKDDYYELRKFYYLLSAGNFVTKSGKSKTEELLSEIRVEQEAITKNFYKEYKLLRQELIKDIVTNNSISKEDFAMTIEKAQKLIDRVVFVCFCEDKDLLPDGILLRVIEAADSGFNSVWETMKGFFAAIDKGSEKLGIPDGYNGGLFAEDQVLNDLKITDAVCKKFLEFGNFDFSEDLSVNILGHIFEQSISDIEELKAKTIEGEEVDKKKSKRKKDGIFYTPDYIVDYIVKNSLGKFLEEKEAEIKAKNNLKEEITDVNYKKRALASYLEYQSALRNVKVLDPACGSGAFLVKVFDYLLAENIRVANIIADLNNDQTDFMSSEGYIKSLLENNIYGVDLNPESVEITKLSLWLKSAQKGKKLVDLNDNIKCGNSLIDDPAVAGERAFKWEEEFKTIMDAGGFDVVVGNPPYVLCQPSNTPESILNFYKNNFEIASYKIDLFHLFIEKSIKVLKKGGLLGFITPSTYFTNKYIQSLRNFILNHCDIKSLVLFEDEVFEDASVETSIITIKKGNSKNSHVESFMMDSKGELKKISKIEQIIWEKEEENVFNINEQTGADLKNCKKLDDIVEIYFGIQAYDRKSSISKQKLNEDYIEMIDGADINPFSKSSPKLFFHFKADNIKSGGNYEVYKKDRIVVRQIGLNPIVGFCEAGILTSNTIYNIYPKNSDFDLKFILTLLNSNFIKWHWLKKFSDNKKTFPKIKGYQIKQLPIPVANKLIQQPFIEKADLMLSLHKTFHEKLQAFLKLIQTEYNLPKITKKLEKFYTLEFEDFVKELKSAKLTLDQKADLLAFFEKNKKELLELKHQIDSTDHQIDEMVFELYGLTEEEREVVLKS